MSQNYNMLYTNEQKFVNMVAYTEKTYISFSEGGLGGGADKPIRPRKWVNLK